MNVRILTLVLYLVGAAGTVSGTVLSFFQLIGQGSLGGAVVAGLGAAAMVAANVLHVVDPISGALTPGDIRVMTAVNFWLGVAIAAADAIAGGVGIGGHVQVFAHYFVAGVGVLQAILAAALNTADKARISPMRRAAAQRAQALAGALGQAEGNAGGVASPA